ncbi:unnamed protein product [Ectocarpus sp. 8 AP-2014]
MASPPLRIRVRCPTVCPAPVELEGCTPQTRFADFQSMILKALGRESEQGLSILTGFPPSRPLDMPEDAEIGGKLSDNESVTVRLATQTAGIQQGGKWGRSKRGKMANTATAATTTITSAASTRSISRASRTPAAAAAAGAGDATTATDDADRSSSDPSGGPAGKKKPTGKAKNAGERTAASSGGRKSGSSGGATARGAGSASASSGTSGGGGRAGGVHTLGGPLTPPAASPRRRGSGGGSSGRPGTSPAAAPGQVRTLFGSSAATSGRAAGGSSSSNGAAAAAAARRAGGAAAGSSGSSPSPSAGGGGGGGEPDAVATAVAAATGGSGAPNRKRPRGTGVQLKSEGDIAERLLTAVGGGGKGTADRFFRKAMKLAVDKQYDQSRADARVRAALGGWYTAEASATQRRLGDGESVALDISFSKGAGAKSQLTETVDRIPREQVSAVVRMIARDPESREMLKPHNFAGCSPRMFWSLVQHWGGDVPAALRLAAPDVDWGFVETRDRKPSEKAVANAAAEEAERREAEEERAERARAKRKRKRRKRRKEGIETDSSEEEKEEPQDAAESLPADEVSEEARAASAAAAAADARRRAANAALARLTASQRRPAPAAAGGSAVSAAVAVAPVVPATEEENGDGVEEEEEDEEDEEEELDMEGLVEVAGEPGAGLLVAAGLRTLGQLADRDEEDLARQLAALQQQQQQQQQQQERDAGEGSAAGEGAAADGGAGGGGGGGSGGGEKARVTAEEVSEWVQGARGEELDEIMADIVGGNEDVIEALEEVSVSTPRDLVRMGAFPDVLVGAVRDKVGAERFAPLAGLITAEAVETWRRKGDRLLEQRPWLELWVHQG